jgi:hypothetical protein
MAGFLIGKDGKGFIWSQSDDEPFAPEIYLEPDVDGVILAIRDADLSVAMEFGAKLGEEAFATVKQDPYCKVDEGLLKSVIDAEAEKKYQHPRFRRFFTKAMLGSFWTTYQKLEDEHLLN